MVIKKICKNVNYYKDANKFKIEKLKEKKFKFKYII